MTTFNTTDLATKSSLDTETTALLSDAELDVVTGGMNKPPVLPPHSGPTDPRQF